MPAKSTETKNNWKDLIQGFIGNVFERLSDNVSKRVHLFIKQLKRRSIGVALLLIGAIFVFISIAMFLNFLFGNQFPWLGWSLVGLIVALIGYELIKQ